MTTDALPVPTPSTPEASPLRAPRRRAGAGRTAVVLAAVGLLLALLAPAGAATSADPVVVRALQADGRFVEVPTDAAVEAAADRANAAGVAFAWLDRSGDEQTAVLLADEYVEELGAANSRYDTVLLIVGNGFAASSLVWDQSDLDRALDAAFVGFADGDMAGGLDGFTGALPAAEASTTATTTGAAGDPDDDSSGGGIGFGTILLLIALAGGGFLLVRSFLRRRREREQAAVDLAEDRAEIKEQLKNNADRVIALGDRVIARNDRELIVLYEQASAAYQQVSHEVDEAETATEIDELDDRIDHAEWQFEVIEAALDGRPRPRPPAPNDDDLDDEDVDHLDDLGDRADPRRRDDQDRLDDVDERASAGAGRRGSRNLPPPVVTSPRTGRSSPRSTTRRRGGGGLGGAIGGGLGGILADIVLGGGMGGLGGRSRRTRTRSDRRGGISPGGGLGGGVLRRGGSSSSRTRSTGPRRRASRSSGGRSLGGRSRSRGGRRL